VHPHGAASCRGATRPVLAHVAGPLRPCATDSGGPSVPKGGRVPQEQEAAPFALLAGYAFANLAALQCRQFVIDEAADLNRSAAFNK